MSAEFIMLEAGDGAVRFRTSSIESYRYVEGLEQTRVALRDGVLWAIPGNVTGLLDQFFRPRSLRETL